jgi:hypothetical protein
MECGSRVPCLPACPAAFVSEKAIQEVAAQLRARVLYRDDELMVIDKPAGLAVQGGPGEPSFHAPPSSLRASGALGFEGVDAAEDNGNERQAGPHAAGQTDRAGTCTGRASTAAIAMRQQRMREHAMVGCPSATETNQDSLGPVWHAE